MDPTALYESFKALEDPGFWQEAYMKFYNAWFYEDRWVTYFQGLLTTVEVTVIALILGVILGVVVATIRTAHDQQRLGRRNPVLGVVNLFCKIYVTVIRGTPMMVQLMIMGFVIFKSSRNFTMVGALSLGINSGAYVAEIIRGGLMSLDPGQSEAGRSLGLGTPCVLSSSPRPSRPSSPLWATSSSRCSRTPPSSALLPARRSSISPSPSSPRPMRPCIPMSSPPSCT